MGYLWPKNPQGNKNNEKLWGWVYKPNFLNLRWLPATHLHNSLHFQRKCLETEGTEVSSLKSFWLIQYSVTYGLEINIQQHKQ